MPARAIHTRASAGQLLRRLWTRTQCAYLRLLVRSACCDIAHMQAQLDAMPAQMELHRRVINAHMVRIALLEQCP